MNPNNEKEVKDITRKIFVVLIKLESEIKKSTFEIIYLKRNFFLKWNSLDLKIFE